MLSKMHRASSVPVLGLVDNDSAGRKSLQKFMKAKKIEGTEIFALNIIHGIYFAALPIPEDFAIARSKYKEVLGNSTEIPLFIENLFPSELSAEAISAKKLRLKDKIITAREGELSLPINVSENYKSKMPRGFSHWAYDIDDACKHDFSEWIKEQDAEVFRYFDVLFEWLQKLSALHTKN